MHSVCFFTERNDWEGLSAGCLKATKVDVVQYSKILYSEKTMTTSIRIEDVRTHCAFPYFEVTAHQFAICTCPFRRKLEIKKTNKSRDTNTMKANGFFNK